MGKDSPSLLSIANIKLDLEVNGSPFGVLEGRPSEVAQRVLSQIAAAGGDVPYNITMIEPRYFAKLTESEKKTLTEMVTSTGLLGIAFLANHLGLVSYPEIGIK